MIKDCVLSLFMEAKKIVTENGSEKICVLHQE
jgi:hypothetical protein